MVIRVPIDMTKNTETENLARIIFRTFLFGAKQIAVLYGWSVKDENGVFLTEISNCTIAHTTESGTRLIKVQRESSPFR